MGLYNLVHNSQPQSGSSHKARLQRLKDLHTLSRIDSHAGVTEADAHPERTSFEFYRQGTAFRHGTQSVVAEVPKDLLDSITVRSHSHWFCRKDTLDIVFALPLRMPFEERQSFVQQFRKISLGKFVAFFAGVLQEITDDAIEALRLAADNVHKMFFVLLQRNHPPEFFHRSSHCC